MYLTIMFGHFYYIKLDLDKILMQEDKNYFILVSLL